MPQTNRRVLLASRPEGWPSAENFLLDEQAIPEPGPGEFVTQNLYLSVDPYMRGRMNDVKSYVPPFQIGEVLQAGVVAKVIASQHDGFQVGDHVVGMLNWENYTLTQGAMIRKIDPEIAPLSYHLGILGMPGATAYVGLTHIAACQEGEKVFVSAASGAVGSVVGQIAKNLNCYVAGSAGSDEKVSYLIDELGFDSAFNYKKADSIHNAVSTAMPKGIDVYFENVGGEMLEAAIWNIRNQGRIALCGMISDYNTAPAELPPGPRGLAILVGRSVRMQGFIVSNYPELSAEWTKMGAKWLSEGKLHYRESTVKGIENAPAAFMGLLKGENFGKQVVKLTND